MELVDNRKRRPALNGASARRATGQLNWDEVSRRPTRKMKFPPELAIQLSDIASSQPAVIENRVVAESRHFVHVAKDALAVRLCQLD
jgi:hypothetical protein